jgi:glycosyltransferase involved in cell wall biosynthesis
VNSNKNPLLSVLLPVHQGEDFLEEVLENVINQTFSDFELIILDNLSTDNSAVIIKKFQDKDTRIKYFLDSERRNGNDCFSELIKYAKGEYCIVINDDNILDLNFFFILINNIKNQDQYQWVMTNGVYINKEKKKIKSFFNNECYLEGKSGIYKIILFYFLGDVIPLILTSIYKTELYKSLLPYINLSKFENDADTIMGFKILSTLNIKYIHRELIFCRIYEDHQRHHSFKVPTKYLSFLYEKVFHEINLLIHLWNLTINSPMSILKKIFLVFFLPILIIIKAIKIFLYKNLSSIKRIIIR